MQPYEWALLRVVPRVERGEFVNAGVVVYCKPLDYLCAGLAFDETRALVLDPALDVTAVRAHLDAIERVCRGDPGAGAIASEPLGRRFGWLTAPRSTVVQPSPIHTGLTADPPAELERLLETMVRPP